MTASVGTQSSSASRFLLVQNSFLCLYVAALGTTMSGMEIFSVLLCVGLGVGLVGFRSQSLVQPFAWPIPPLWLPVTVFMAVATLSIVFGYAEGGEKTYDLSRMRFFLLYFAIFLHLRLFSEGAPWRRVLFWVALIVGVYGMVQHFIPLDLVRPEGKKIYRFAIQDERIGPLVIGTFNHHLTFSNIYLFFACLALGWGFSGRRWAFVLAAVLFLDVLWTGSRTALVAVPLAVFGVAARNNRRTALRVALAGGVGLALIVLTNQGIRERVVRTFSGTDAQYNLGPRMRLWHANWEMFKEHPWLGVGYNQNERMVAPYLDRLYPEQENFYGHAHSLPLQILASTGLLGALAFAFLWFSVLKMAWDVHRRAPPGSREYWEAWALGIGWLGFTIQGVSQWNFGDAEVTHVVIFVWALLSLLHDKVCGGRTARL